MKCIVQNVAFSLINWTMHNFRFPELHLNFSLGLTSVISPLRSLRVHTNNAAIETILTKKYGTLSTAALKENKELREDLMERDINKTITLQIVYRKLNIQSVRATFQESVGNRLKKFGQPNNKNLLR